VCCSAYCGRGITSLDQIVSLLHSGADKIAINTAAYSNPALIEAAAGRFGSQCVVVSIDARRFEDGRYGCFSHSATVDTGRDPLNGPRS